MQIAVMGAGAVGCYFGALLARAGHDVTLIGRPALAQAVRANGLMLESAAFTGSIALHAETDPAAVRAAELVLFCVKSGDTEAAGAQIAAHLREGSRILSLQNGVDNAARLARVLGRPVIPAVVYVATEMAGVAHVRHHGRGELVIGPSEQSGALAKLLSAAGIPTDVSDKVGNALWSKLVINCVYNALSAIGQRPYGELVRTDGVLEVMTEVFGECIAVARARDVELPASLWQSTLDIAASMPGQRSSTAQDLARGKPSEIDHLNGTITRLGQASGVPTPANRALWCAVKLLEQAQA